MRPPTASPARNAMAIGLVVDHKAAERRNRIANADAAYLLAATRQYAVFSCQGGGSRDFRASLQRPQNPRHAFGANLVALRLTAPRDGRQLRSLWQLTPDRPLYGERASLLATGQHQKP
jgi:hypothetical protein